MRNKEYLEHLIRQVKYDMDLYHVPYKETEFHLNGRLSRSLGRCCFPKQGPIRIEIQKDFFFKGKEEDLKNTICHELIHSACKEDGHTGRWLKYAKIMNQHGYDIHRTSMVEFDKTTPYQVYCPKCGHIWYYKTYCKVVQRPDLYKCRKCNISLKCRIMNVR